MRTESIEDRRLALMCRLAPKGTCAECGRKIGHAALEVDHIDGRSWRARDVSRVRRLEIYTHELDTGVRLRALCRSCNARDGGGRRYGKRK